MKCPNCNNEVLSEWRVCPFCKYEPVKCSNPKCNAGWLPQNASFCPICGSKLKDAINAANQDNSTNFKGKEEIKTGVFSIAPGKKVIFSPGNLQYQASTKTWRFAEHQWETIGSTNEYISSNYQGWIDLFGWGTGENPTCGSDKARDYCLFNDWGRNNISNGKNKKWFTLSIDEWWYLLDERATNSGLRYTHAIINRVKGIMLFPDEWDKSKCNLIQIDEDTVNNGENISQDDWVMQFEKTGVVFLPATGGYRMYGGLFFIGQVVYDLNISGRYWSSTIGDREYAYAIETNGSITGSTFIDRSDGLSVRLVSLV